MKKLSSADGTVPRWVLHPKSACRFRWTCATSHAGELAVDQPTLSGRQHDQVIPRRVLAALLMALSTGFPEALNCSDSGNPQPATCWSVSRGVRPRQLLRFL